jgi:hypothetical protein
MDPLQELLQLLTETGDTSGWQELLFGSESAESEANRFDEMDREAGAPVGILREAWAMARTQGSRGQRR